MLLSGPEIQVKRPLCGQSGRERRVDLKAVLEMVTQRISYTSYSRLTTVLVVTTAFRRLDR